MLVHHHMRGLENFISCLSLSQSVHHHMRGLETFEVVALSFKPSSPPHAWLRNLALEG